LEKDDEINLPMIWSSSTEKVTPITNEEAEARVFQQKLDSKLSVTVTVYREEPLSSLPGYLNSIDIAVKPTKDLPPQTGPGPVLTATNLLRPAVDKLAASPQTAEALVEDFKDAPATPPPGATKTHGD
jgi:hypothetical protein